MRVLIIEDNPGDARLIQEMLKETGGDYKTDVVERLGQAFEFLSSHKVDVALTDLGLPDSSGLETLAKLQKQFSYLPIVIMTSIADEALGVQAVHLGAQDFLTKGSANGELLKRILLYAAERKKSEESLRKAHDELETRVQQRTMELQEAQQVLSEVNEKLERRVTERTAELEHANAMLRDSRRAALNMMEDALAARRKAEDAAVKLGENEVRLRSSEAILKQAGQMANLGAWEIIISNYDDLNANPLHWSDEVYRIFGYEPGEVAVSNILFFERVHPDDRAPIMDAVAQAIETKTPYSIEHRIIRPNGAERIVLEYGEIAFDDKDRPVHIRGAVQDITERKRNEADLLKLSEDMAARNVELEAVNKELESYIYSISHDLRAPLRSMGGFARIMVEDYFEGLDDRGRDYLRRISIGAEKMTKIIDDLLNLAKISRQETVRMKINLSKLALSVVSELREAHPKRKVHISIQEGLTAFADLRLMEIVLANLLGNAWKFTSKTEDARIEFAAASEEGRTVYFIRDNGAGFDPKYVEKMFWPFQRLHSESEFEGTGIGLTIVERIVHRHGGTIWAEGEKGKGATVYFTLGKA